MAGHKKEKGEIRTRQKIRKARRAWPKKKVKDGKEENNAKLEDERMMEIKVEKKKPQRKNNPSWLLILYARHEHCLTGASPE